MHLLTNLYPGSDIAGVPASHTKVTFNPIFNMATNLSNLYSSLNL